MTMVLLYDHEVRAAGRSLEALRAIYADDTSTDSARAIAIRAAMDLCATALAGTERDGIVLALVRADELVRIRPAAKKASSEAHSLPAGWCAVPLEPTDEMVDAAEAVTGGELLRDEDLRPAYRAMVATAPNLKA
jgi:hypothetical protein